MAHAKSISLAVALSWAVWITTESILPFSPHVEKYETRESAKATVKGDSPSSDFFAFGVIEFIDTHNGLVSALATIAIAYFTWSLRQSTDKLWAAGEKQLLISKTMADAAVLAQRARIQITPTWETGMPPGQYSLGQTLAPPEYKFLSRMDNVGQMPAANLQNRIDYLLVSEDIPINYQFPDDAPALSGAGVLGTKQFLLGPHVPPDRYISAVEIDKMKSEELNLYLFGWVRYFDGFLGTPERVTTFCYRVRVTGNPNLPVVFIPHERHNHSD